MNVENFFIDTNILIYFVKDSTGKAELIDTILLNNSENYISTQVANEFCNVALKKLNFSTEELIFLLENFAQFFNIYTVNISTIKKALKIKEKYAYSYYDSVIIASALQTNCSTLYTEDMHHGQIIDNRLTIINPFI